MPEHQPHSVFTRGRLLLLTGALMMAALLIWGAWRDSGTEKAIKQKLAGMRAAGELLEVQELARMFPDPPPEHDTLSVFAAAFMIPTNVVAIGPVPIMTSEGNYDRRSPMAAATGAAITNYCGRTAGLTNLMPESCPAETRLAVHWNRGGPNMLSGLRPVRTLIQSLAVHTLNAIEAGDQAAAAQLLEHDFRFARAVHAESSLVAHMLQHACDNVACAVAERALNRLAFTEAQLARIASVMSLENPHGLTHAMLATSCEAIRAFQQVQLGRPVPGWTSEPEPFWKRPIRRWREGPEYRDKDFLLYLEFISRSRPLGSMTGTQAVARSEALHTEFTKRAQSRIGREAMSRSWSGMVKAHCSSMARMESARTAFAIERFRLAHQQALPNSLAELVPSYLPAVPRDPFDHQPLRFKKLPRGYVVYSVGPDGVDNGGAESPTQNVTTNYDVTFTVER
jgi:hypothetical protein